jgi:hypothetical protein
LNGIQQKGIDTVCPYSFGQRFQYRFRLGQYLADPGSQGVLAMPLALFGTVLVNVILLGTRNKRQTVCLRRIKEHNLVVAGLKMTRQCSHRIKMTR